MNKNILIVLTSNDQLGDTGKQTGFWLEELASPYYLLKEAGISLTLATPKGGQAPIDPVSELEDFQTEATRRFTADADAMAQLGSTHKLSEMEAANFDAILYPGGQGPLWDLVSDPEAIRLTEAFWASDKLVVTICHASAVLVNPKDSKGTHIVKGRKVTGFSNAEETEYGTNEVVPLLLEDELKARGGDYTKGPNWQPFTCQDGRLITGQNPASSEAVAKLLLAALSD